MHIHAIPRLIYSRFGYPHLTEVIRFQGTEFDPSNGRSEWMRKPQSGKMMLAIKHERPITRPPAPVAIDAMNESKVNQKGAYATPGLSGGVAKERPECGIIRNASE